MKPQTKSEAAIYFRGPTTRWIEFYATPDVASDIGRFGRVEPSSGIQNQYALTVDSRFDFDEVVAYIENYGKEKE